MFIFQSYIAINFKLLHTDIYKFIDQPAGLEIKGRKIGRLYGSWVEAHIFYIYRDPCRQIQYRIIVTNIKWYKQTYLDDMELFQHMQTIHDILLFIWYSLIFHAFVGISIKNVTNLKASSACQSLCKIFVLPLTSVKREPALVKRNIHTYSIKDIHSTSIQGGWGSIVSVSTWVALCRCSYQTDFTTPLVSLLELHTHNFCHKMTTIPWK